MNMMYEVFVYNSYFQRRDGEKVFSKIQDARKYGYKLLKNYPTAQGGQVEVVKTFSVSHEWYRISKYHGQVYFKTNTNSECWILNADGSLGEKVKG